MGTAEHELKTAVPVLSENGQIAEESHLTNLARNKKATQSSVSNWSRGRTAEEDAANAVNGDFSKHYGFHTNIDLHPWWMVDFGQVGEIRAIRIFNRNEDNEYLLMRASPLLIEISITGHQWFPLFRTSNGFRFTGFNGGHPLEWRADEPVDARFVRISILRREYLHLSEVEIFGRFTNGPSQRSEKIVAEPDNAGNNAPSQSESLDSIGVRYGTDKSSIRHDYLHLYENFLGNLRYEPLSLLELGVLEGASLSMWAEYFPNARIVGVDIAPMIYRHPNRRVTIEIADQSNVGDLVTLGRTYGPIDLVIDDGSHIWDHQITSLRYLLPFIRSGGYYILEDIDTSYGTYIEQYRGTSGISAAAYLHKLCEYMVGDAALDIAREPDAFIRSYAQRCQFICFARRTSIIRLR
jgi:hypothetical protein